MIRVGPTTQGDNGLEQWRLWVTFSEFWNRIFINAGIKIPWSCLHFFGLEEAVMGLCQVCNCEHRTLSAEHDCVQSQAGEWSKVEELDPRDGAGRAGIHPASVHLEGPEGRYSVLQ